MLANKSMCRNLKR